MVNPWEPMQSYTARKQHLVNTREECLAVAKIIALTQSFLQHMDEEKEWDSIH